MKYLKRILGLPFFLMLNVIGIIFHLFKISRAFILYGGEAMAYDKKTTQKMIYDIYFELEKRHLTESKLPDKDEAVSFGYRKANNSDYDYRKVISDLDNDIYYSGWMDCFDWLSEKTK